MSLNYAVVLKKARDNWAAYVPDLPGCATTAGTLSQAKINMREAIGEHLRTLHDFGDPVPAPSTLAMKIEVISVA